MATFNLKKNKIRAITNIKTLDEIHTNKMLLFQDNKSTISDKKEELEKLKYALYQIEELSDFSQFTNVDIQNRSDIKTKIDDLERYIADIENNTDEIEYYDKTLNIINEYYSNKMDFCLDDNNTINNDTAMEDENIIEATEKTSDSNLTKLIGQRNTGSNRKVKLPPKKRKQDKVYSRPSILDFLGGKDDIDNKKITDNVDSSSSSSPIPQNKDRSNSKTCSDSLLVDNVGLLNKYNMLVNNEFISNKKQNYMSMTKCTTCNEDKVLNKSEAIYVCKSCGVFDMVIVEADKPSYKDISSDKPGYPYKRINHFNEWLSQFQAKESYEIPVEIYNQIAEKLHKNRVVDFKKLKMKQIKEILKSLSLANYYEHVVHIISKLSGLPPPMVDRATEEKLRNMFKLIQIPFENHRPKDRINFLSYSFVLHKFCQLLELDEFIKCFPLLKSRDKLRQQDIIWKGICKDLKWEYFPSI